MITPEPEPCACRCGSASWAIPCPDLDLNRSSKPRSFTSLGTIVVSMLTTAGSTCETTSATGLCDERANMTSGRPGADAISCVGHEPASISPDRNATVATKQQITSQGVPGGFCGANVDLSLVLNVFKISTLGRFLLAT